MLVLISGLPGAGKSYFALALKDKIGAHYLSSDVIRDELGYRGQYQEERKKHIYKLMLERTRQLLQSGEDVIVDSTFYKKSFRDLFVRIAEKSNAPFFIIKIIAREEVIKERVKKKRRFSEAGFDVYQAIKQQFEPIERKHLVIPSDTESLDFMLDSALNYFESIKVK